MTKTILMMQNDGPNIVATNYWETDTERAGKVLCSVNAGTIRVLLPRSCYHALAEMRTGRTVIVSLGPWIEKGIGDAVEILFDDGSDAPYALHLTAEAFDVLPAEPKGGEWKIAVWTEGPVKAIAEQVCHWRRVMKIPCLEPWKKGPGE